MKMQVKVNKTLRANMPDFNLQNKENAVDTVIIKDESGNFFIYEDGNIKPYNFNAPEKKSVNSQSLSAPSIALIDTGMEEPMLQPPPPVVRKTTASFYFHPEDEEDVAKIKKLTRENEGKHYSLDKIINKVIENNQLSFKPEPLLKLKNIAFSYLRDRRTLMDAKDALARSLDSGGLGLTVELADKIINFLKDVKNKINAERGLVVDEKSEISAPSAALPIKPAITTPSVDLKPLPRLADNQQLATPPLKEIKPRAATSFSPEKTLPKFQRPIKQGTMSDVKKDYKLVGPIEEIGNLTLETFKMLGADTKRRAEKIISRLESLGEKSLIKKAAGINAWRNSPLYKMYLAVGQASLEHGVDVPQIIQQSKLAGKDILSLEEFEAISDINKKLRY